MCWRNFTCRLPDGVANPDDVAGEGYKRELSSLIRWDQDALSCAGAETVVSFLRFLCCMLACLCQWLPRSHDMQGAEG